MIIFTLGQWRRLLAGEQIERTFPVLPRDDETKQIQPCPFRVDDTEVYLAKRDMAKKARMQVRAVEVRREIDWHVTFERAPMKQEVRLLAKSSHLGYTDKPERAVDPTQLDPGEAPPKTLDDDFSVKHEWAKRQAALDAMREAFGGDPAMRHHLREIERRANQLAA